jgi:hypothetical protein
MTPFSELPQLAQQDDALRQELLDRGELFSGYHPEMEALHIANGTKLEALIDAFGWPREKEYSDAAWLIAQHAISLPELQKKILLLLKNDPSLCSPKQAAMLEDRILVLSGKNQLYGTQMDWDEDGILNPYPVEDPDDVDERRHKAGLDKLQDAINQLRKQAETENENPPEYFRERKKSEEEWRKRVGWI